MRNYLPSLWSISLGKWNGEGQRMATPSISYILCVLSHTQALKPELLGFPCCLKVIWNFFCEHAALRLVCHWRISLEEVLAWTLTQDLASDLALIYWNMCISLKTTRQFQHKHLSFQKITPCQNAPERNVFLWFEVEAVAATAVRQQVFLERWQLGLSDINAELHNPCMLQEKCNKQLFLHYHI